MPVRERLDTVPQLSNQPSEPSRRSDRPETSFFDLPIELRNQIYTHLAESKHSIPLKLHDRPFAYFKVLTPHARLINRQFKAEAEAQIAKFATLYLKDRSESDGCGPPTRFRSPSWRWCLDSVTRLEMEVHLGCDGCNWECLVSRGLRNDTAWLIPFVAGLRKLEAVDVELYFWWEPDCVEELGGALSAKPRASAFGSALRRLVDEVPHIRSLKVHRHSADSLYSGSTAASCKDLGRVIWHADRGWQVSGGQEECDLKGTLRDATSDETWSNGWMATIPEDDLP